MAIYRLTSDSVTQLTITSLAAHGIRERQDLQRLLRARIDAIAPDTMVLAEEFGEWEESRRRIDLLALDADANLVVIELKRTEDGGHMDLQAIRYAALVSTMTFDQAVAAHRKYLASHASEDDPREAILEFLGWTEPDEELFANDVRIVLAAADFSKELTSSVLWLNQRDLDIRCVRLMPYGDEENLFLEIQQVIPLPEAADYTIKVKEKVRAERRTRSEKRRTYKVSAGGQVFEGLSRRRAVLAIVRALCAQGINPSSIKSLFPWRGEPAVLLADRAIRRI